jgi:hypothetical protein
MVRPPSVTVPRTGTPPRLRVQAYCRPCGDTTSTGAPSPTASSITPSTRTASVEFVPLRGANSTLARARREVRSVNRSPSHTTHHDTRAGPTCAVAAHSITSSENAPTHVQRFSGRPPRSGGIRPGGSGRSGRPGPGPRQGWIRMAER